jgi:hypothetical protein
MTIQRPDLKKAFTKKIFIVSLLMLFFLAIYFQPWQRKIKVLTVVIPKLNVTIELWEKPKIDFISLSLEHATWLAVRSKNGNCKWHVIDEHYITFRKISVFLSIDQQLVRVETNGESEETHMIAEYNLKKDAFYSRSNSTVRNEKGWFLLTEKVIR